MGKAVLLSGCLPCSRRMLVAGVPGQQLRPPGRAWHQLCLSLLTQPLLGIFFCPLPEVARGLPSPVSPPLSHWGHARVDTHWGGKRGMAGGLKG